MDKKLVRHITKLAALASGYAKPKTTS